MKAAKKADRTAAEGLLAMRVSESGDSGAMVEVNSETDFAARNERFVEFANTAVDWVLEHGEGRMEGLEEAREQLVQIIGENVSVRRAVRFVSQAVKWVVICTPTISLVRWLKLAARTIY